MKMATVEAEMNHKIIDKLSNELYENQRSMRLVKNVLRVPRLYNSYKQLMSEVTTEAQLKAHLTSQVYKESENFDQEGKKSISEALKMSFVN